jgi:hypothetical protein
MKTRMVAGLVCTLTCLATAMVACGQDHELEGASLFERADVRPYDKFDKPQEYLLRYKFHSGDALRWTVVHCSKVHTSISGTVQSAETTTSSVKVWRVHEVKPNGQIVFDHMVESVDMRHRLTGRDEVHYNSLTDPVAPKGFEDVARAVGVPLALVTIDSEGKLIQRKQNFVKAAVAGQGEITIQLPDHPVAVGGHWSSLNNLDVPLSDGTIRRFKTMQLFKLENVKTGVATISVSTQFMTPIEDPSIEAQVVQYETSGSIRFDIDAGQILARQVDVDRSVVGFRGEASSIRYIGRSTESMLPAARKVAAKQ